MTGGLQPAGATTAELALRLLASRGTAVYVAYLATEAQIPVVLTELTEELTALDHSLGVLVLKPSSTKELLSTLAVTVTEVVLINAGEYQHVDWAVLDLRRSSLSHKGILVFVTTTSSFADLMRAAPNLASWLGSVFAYGDDSAQVADAREHRLSALRSWARQSDSEVVHAALQGRLPADPEYAEWLVLLGRGDLLGP
jgi:hypothetical protein